VRPITVNRSSATPSKENTLCIHERTRVARDLHRRLTRGGERIGHADHGDTGQSHQRGKVHGEGDRATADHADAHSTGIMHGRA